MQDRNRLNTPKKWQVSNPNDVLELLVDLGGEEIFYASPNKATYFKDSKYHTLEIEGLSPDQFTRELQTFAFQQGMELHPHLPEATGMILNFRWYAIIPPFVKYPYISFRKHHFKSLTLQSFGDIPAKTHGRVIVFGQTGAGKTSFLYCLAQKHSQERVVVIEDMDEFPIDDLPYWTKLFTRPPSEHTAKRTLMDHLKSTLRMRPSGVILAELRLEEISAFSEASLLGYSFSYCTMHANHIRQLKMQLKRYPGVGAISCFHLENRKVKEYFELNEESE